MQYSYILIKPDGLIFFDAIRKSLKENLVDIKQIYCIKNFDEVAIKLYLNPEAILRGNAPIIIGINEVWKKKYGTTAYLLLVAPSKGKEDAFVEKVCAWKKRFRKEHIQGAYIGLIAKVEEQAYMEYEIMFSKTLAQKREIEGKEYYYELQLNAIHSPDDSSALEKEMKVLHNNGAFLKRVFIDE